MTRMSSIASQIFQEDPNCSDREGLPSPPPLPCPFSSHPGHTARDPPPGVPAVPQPYVLMGTEVLVSLLGAALLTIKPFKN